MGHPNKFRAKGESLASREKRACRAGTGIEITAFMRNTPGFRRREQPEIVNDIRGFRRIELPRNNRRILQSSIYCLQSWRANCDVQILIYKSDPQHPSPEDIAAATDYIVGYACKGNENLTTEKKQIEQLILNAEDLDGDQSDLTRLARQILNKSIGEKMISKQEAMVHLAQLRLFDCSERIETQSLSGYYKLNSSRQGRASSSTLLARYADRPPALKEYTLYEYFFVSKNIENKAKARTIPHFVGGSSQPSYPPKEGYARSMLLLHSKWTKEFEYSGNANGPKAAPIFTDLVENNKLPLYVSIPYHRMKARYDRGGNVYEPTISDSHSDPIPKYAPIPSDLLEIVQLVSTLSHKVSDSDMHSPSINYGLDHDWSTPNHKVRTHKYVLFLLSIILPVSYNTFHSHTNLYPSFPSH